MVVTCSIEFDNNPHGTYFAGQILTGKVTLQADKPKQLKAITLRIKGFAHTKWTDSSSRRKNGSRSNTTYRGHEDYISSLTYLLGSDESVSTVLQPGMHVFNFTCHLPNSCPSSYESHYGHVRYMVQVALVRPWKFDQTYTKGFTVLKVLDLNYDTPLLKIPAKQEAEKAFGCGLCRSEPLRMFVTLPQTGYVPGQVIPVNVLIANNSHIPIADIKVELVMKVCFYSQTPSSRTKSERIVLWKMKGDSVMKYCNKQFDYQLFVPATPPTCFNLCKIIQIAYAVEVEAKVTGFHTNQVVSTPVTIGNVPFVGLIQRQPSFGSGNMRRSLSFHGISNAGLVDDEFKVAGDVTPRSVRMSASPWQFDADIPPPTYQEAVHIPHVKINADEAHDYGESDFVPRYPVFNFNPSPTPYNEGDENNNKGTWL